MEAKECEGRRAVQGIYADAIHAHMIVIRQAVLIQSVLPRCDRRSCDLSSTLTSFKSRMAIDFTSRALLSLLTDACKLEIAMALSVSVRERFIHTS